MSNVPRPDGSGRAGGGAGRSRPTANRRPPAASKPSALSASKVVGADDEELIDPAAPKPKHLKMVPLNGRQGASYDDGKDLGTEGFHRPNVPMGPPMGAPGGPMMGGPPMMGIQGPVVGMGGPMPTQNMGGGGGYVPMEENRASSQRVFVVLTGLIAMVCLAVMAVMVIVLAVSIQKNTPEPLKQIDTVARPPTPAPSEDTGERKTKPDPSPGPRPPRPPKPPSEPSSGGTPGPKPPSTPKPPPAPAGAAGAVTVTLPPGVVASKIDVICESMAFRERGPFQGQTATVANVPVAGDCVVIVRAPGVQKKVAFGGGGRAFNCSGAGSDLVCR